jgi:hypothetical protein
MGTLIEGTAQGKKSKSHQPFEGPSFSGEESKEMKKARKRVEKEYYKVRKHFEEVRQAFAYVESATALDDVSKRLKLLEKTTRKVRKGGIFGGGASTHARLLRKLRKMPIE